MRNSRRVQFALSALLLGLTACDEHRVHSGDLRIDFPWFGTTVGQEAPVKAYMAFKADKGVKIRGVGNGIAEPTEEFAHDSPGPHNDFEVEIGFRCLKVGVDLVTIEMIDKEDDKVLATAQSTFYCTLGIDEETGQLIYSISTTPAGFAAGYIDIATHGSMVASVTADQAQAFNEACATDNFACATDPAQPDTLPLDIPHEPSLFREDIVAGDIIHVVANHADAIPTDADKQLIYSLVFDSDGDPANDWVPNDPFDWDFFQGTDRWYQLVWDGEWTVTATQVSVDQTTEQVDSGARAHILDNQVLWFIPRTELGGGNPQYRVTAFAHDGDFAPTTSGGDVSGGTPTQPLTPIGPSE